MSARSSSGHGEQHGEPVLNFAGNSTDLGAHSLPNAAGDEVPLTHGEFGLLRGFERRPGRVPSRDQLLQLLAGRDIDTIDPGIDTHIARRRRKIEADPRHPALLLTIPATGYKFAAKVRQAEAPVWQEPASSALSVTPAYRFFGADGQGGGRGSWLMRGPSRRKGQ